MSARLTPSECVFGNRTRHVPLNAEALQVLTDWMDDCVGAEDDSLVFAGKSGHRLDNIAVSWRGLMKKSKLKVRSHDLRHTFASRLLQRGGDLAVVRELLGHSDFKLTQRYSHLAMDNKRAAVERLCALSEERESGIDDRRTAGTA